MPNQIEQADSKQLAEITSVMQSKPTAAFEMIKHLLLDYPTDDALYKLLSLVVENLKANEPNYYAKQVIPQGINIMIPRIVEALQKDDLETAELIIRARLLVYPAEATTIRLMAELVRRLDMLAGTERLLLLAQEIAPDNVQIWLDLARLYKSTNRNDEAIAYLNRVLSKNPNDVGAIYLKATVSSQAGLADEAISLFKSLVTTTPSQASFWIGYGRALKTNGKMTEAVAAFRQAIALSPQLGEAWWSISDLKTAKFEDADIERMEALLLDTALSDIDAGYLHFALGKAHEDNKNFKNSFTHYERGNAIKRASLDYDTDRFLQFVEKSKQLFTTEFFLDRKGYGSEHSDPIFILGMTRAGSTLIEQILASHAQIEGTMELTEMLSIAGDLTEDFKDRPQAIADLDIESTRKYGDEYVEKTKVYRFSNKPYFVDKMPNNWLYIALIHLILPNARIIDARRHPMACCFSNFKQSFGKGQDWSYNLREAGEYYSNYVALLDHFDAVLPNRIHRVYHEKLIDDPRGEIEALLQYLNLPFDEKCLNFHKTERAVRTASAAQVRQPLSRAGVDLWQSYEPWLGDLSDSLRECLENYPHR